MAFSTSCTPARTPLGDPPKPRQPTQRTEPGGCTTEMYIQERGAVQCTLPRTRFCRYLVLKEPRTIPRLAALWRSGLRAATGTSSWRGACCVVYNVRGLWMLKVAKWRQSECQSTMLSKRPQSLECGRLTDKNPHPPQQHGESKRTRSPSAHQGALVQVEAQQGGARAGVAVALVRCFPSRNTHRSICIIVEYNMDK